MATFDLIPQHYPDGTIVLRAEPVTLLERMRRAVRRLLGR